MAPPDWLPRGRADRPWLKAQEKTVHQRQRFNAQEPAGAGGCGIGPHRVGKEPLACFALRHDGAERTSSRRLIPASSIQSSIRVLLDHKAARVTERLGLPACRFRQLAEILFVCQPLGDSPVLR
jgi:hypothetical protein